MTNPGASPSTVDHDLAKAQKCYVVGDKKPADRPVVKRIKKLAQQALLALVLVAMSSQAIAGPADTSVQDVNGQQNHAALVASQHPVAKFVDMPLTQANTQPSWVSQDGRVDGLNMLEMWRDGDVNPTRLYQLTQVMLATQSPVIAATPAARSSSLKIAQDTIGIFQVKNDAQAAEFLKTHSIQALRDRGIIPRQVALIYGYTSSSDVQDTVDLWTGMASEHNTIHKPDLFAKNNDGSMGQAKASLLKAVDDAGLASLTVPLPYWGSSAQIQELANNITKANHELQQATGWDGPVLGLNKNVGFTVGKPMDMGVAWNEGGTMHIQGALRDLAHEWTHAVNMKIRLDAGLPALIGPDGKTPNTDTGIIEAIQDGHVSQDVAEQYALWGNLNDDLVKVGVQAENPWHEQMQKKSDSYTGTTLDATWLRDYYARAHEQIAYSFSSYVDHITQHDKHSALGGDPLNHDGERAPTLQEAELQAPVWKNVMSSLNKTWWGPQIQVSMNELPVDHSPVPGAAVGEKTGLDAPHAMHETLTLGLQTTAAEMLGRLKNRRDGLAPGNTQPGQGLGL